MNELLAQISARAATAPESLAVVGTNGQLTAAELDCAIHSFAAELRQTGITRLGLFAENSPAWVIADLACQAAGICVVPLPPFFSDTQLQNIIERAGIQALLTDTPDRLEQIIPGLPNAFASGAAFGLSLLEVADNRRSKLPEGTSKITFTSGSTGSPRGVCLSTAQQLRVAQALHAAIGLSAPRHLCLLPLSTLLENVGGVYVPLLTDGTVIVPPGADIGLEGSANLDILKMLQALERLQPTSIILLPQMLVALVAAIEDGWTPPATLQFVAVGGAKVSPDLIPLARTAGLPVYEGYGLSETASVACLNRPDCDLPGSVGRPLSHVDVRIENDEIVVRGNAFLGYLDDPQGWFPESIATGDIGHLDDRGFVHIKGRKKNLLISSYGRNISPEWVESLLLSHPILAQCVVFGDARPWCVALLATADPSCPDREIQEWIDAVNADLPDYARVRAWHRLNEPLSAAGGLMTDNGRPRRRLIERQHAPTIESLYVRPPMAKTL